MVRCATTIIIATRALGSYAEAEKKRLERHVGLCAGLIRAYLTSPDFVNLLAPSTQKEYRRLLTAIEAKFGTVPIAAMADPRFAGDALEWRDEIATTKPREADNRMIVFGRLLSWGKKRHKISANVLEGYERIYRTDRSDKIWLPEHIAAMQQVANPELWPVFLGGLYTGLRQGDLRKLPWSAYDGQAITWNITKRRKGSAGVKLRIPCTNALRSLLDSLPRRGPLIFTTTTGRAWQKRYLARQFEVARARAGEGLPEIADLHFHDLRGTAITMLAEAGATVSVRHHGSQLPNDNLDPRAVSAPDQTPCRDGNCQAGEQRTNRFCKPSANRPFGSEEGRG